MTPGGGWDSGARNARLYFTDEFKAKRVGAWCAATPKNQWLQVDLRNEKYITAVGTQGNQFIIHFGLLKCKTLSVLIIYMKKLLDSDWLRTMQFFLNTVQKRGN